MAGDWIKVEHATVDKPEILRIADLLGVKPNEALGIMVSFWVWLDRNSRNGLVTHMSRTTLDNVTHTPGFAACLVDVGWAQIDDATGIITIPNHDRHNGNPAKTRALGKDRATKHRNDSVTPNALPEKRREEKRDTSLRSVSGAPPTKAAISEPSDEHRDFAREAGVDCQAEFLKYRDWLAANGKRQRDESAGFRNWLRKAGEFRARDPPRTVNVHDKRAATARAMYGEPNANPTDRDITAESERVA